MCIMRYAVSRSLLATVFGAIAPISAGLMYGYGSKPRPSSIDASIHAPLTGVELSGIVKRTPVTTHGFTRFFFAPESLGDQVVDGTVQVSDRGEAKVLLGNGVQLTGDVRAMGCCCLLLAGTIRTAAVPTRLCSVERRSSASALELGAASGQREGSSSGNPSRRRASRLISARSSQ